RQIEFAFDQVDHFIVQLDLTMQMRILDEKRHQQWAQVQRTEAPWRRDAQMAMQHSGRATFARGLGASLLEPIENIPCLFIESCSGIGERHSASRTAQQAHSQARLE